MYVINRLKRLAGREYSVVDPSQAVGADYGRLPYVLRIFAENALRHGDTDVVPILQDWLKSGTSKAEVSFRPARILMHDTTCVPALVDIAAMRDAVAEAGGDPERLNPVLPVDVSVDHSVGVDLYADPDAQAFNMRREIERNLERYRFMKWATHTLKGVCVHPPGTGIMHTINLERLATVVSTAERDGTATAFMDTLIGTDSHTPMINGIGVLAWGVGGIEAETVMFGNPVRMRVPDVVGVRLSGRLGPGVLATDLALEVTHRLRQKKIAGQFVEFFGPGVSMLSAGARAVVANMAPEYGASTGYFPIDDHTLSYLLATGRSRAHVDLVRAYVRELGLWFDPEARPRYSDLVEIDLDRIGVNVAGPARPQDRISPSRTAEALAPLLKARDTAVSAEKPGDGAVALAAITSCTNTSDPRLLIAAGLLARKARVLGLKPAGWVKTSFAPGSPGAELYLERAGLLDDLNAIGFGVVGRGCTTCIGNSGDLPSPIQTAMRERNITPVAVLSGNRNFPGRVHPDLRAGFLASPPLVVAYALAGTVMLDILSDPIAADSDGRPVRLADLWPTDTEIDIATQSALSPDDYEAAYAKAENNAAWQAIDAPRTARFPWDPDSTYLRRPPFVSVDEVSRLGHYEAVPFLVLGDDMTTDHISPASHIAPSGAAGQWLTARGENPQDLNVFAARRGNWEAMVRSAFTNRNVKNLLGDDIPPGFTRHARSGELVPLFDAARRYANEGRSVVMVAGERYGMGSSRDWAAKAPALLGIRAVLAVGFERIHRSNLVGMGILPLGLPAGITPTTLSLTPEDRIEIDASAEHLAPRAPVTVRVHRHHDGKVQEFVATALIETAAELQALKAGGIIPEIIASVLEC